MRVDCTMNTWWCPQRIHWVHKAGIVTMGPISILAINTLRPEKNGHYFAHRIFIHFLGWNYFALNLSGVCGLFLGLQLTTSQHWFRKWLATEQATSPFLQISPWNLISRQLRSTQLLLHINVKEVFIVIYFCLSTHWGSDKMATILYSIFKCILTNCRILLKFHWSVFTRVQITTTQHWFR